MEDERALAETIREGLSADGHRVRVAHDGWSGLAAALGAGSDVIVLDIMLPGLSGYRVRGSCGPATCGPRCSC